MPMFCVDYGFRNQHQRPKIVVHQYRNMQKLNKKRWKNGSPNFIRDQEEWSQIKAICVDPTSSNAFGGFDSVTLAYIVIS